MTTELDMHMIALDVVEHEGAFSVTVRVVDRLALNAEHCKVTMEQKSDGKWSWHCDWIDDRLKMLSSERRRMVRNGVLSVAHRAIERRDEAEAPQEPYRVFFGKHVAFHSFRGGAPGA